MLTTADLSFPPTTIPARDQPQASDAATKADSREVAIQGCSWRGPVVISEQTPFDIKITCSSAEDFDALRTQLEKYKVQYYTFQRKSERPHRVVLRGVAELKPEELKEILKEDYSLDVLEAIAMKKKDEPTSGLEVPYVVLFKKGYTNLKKLSEVKSLGNFIVRWEAYRNKKPHVAQCKNCLHLGHGAQNCHLKGRCNNYGGSHTTEKCQNQQKVRCANSVGSHVATDHSCPKRGIHPFTTASVETKATCLAVPAVPAITGAEFPPLPGTVPVDESKSEHSRSTAAT